MTGKDEISRAEAARLLGVSAGVVKRCPIPFRQYRNRGKAIYCRDDVLAFKEKSTTTGTAA
ncbi:hypothetical protein [Thiothrix nivea]|uniref:Helix-turn-helix domain-containing protein n=1 Tax=Thiothrix nivea (strain ATCC 35100 / DSM 5205 / JP2) TaxID=870187 RepID=A0A656HB86_THINJ|nr:hypothetical protein [Thiothrix nivea]EIJ33372.1 hypothetical protein Thini_0735 [Thiothrix nivea DSM 5205]